MSYDETEELILDQELDEDYEPTKKDIYDYAKMIGLDPVNEPELLWIAKEGFLAKLPKDWRACKKRGQIFYVNLLTGERTLDDPCDEEYRNTVRHERLKIIRLKAIEKRRQKPPPKLQYVEMHVQGSTDDHGATVITKTLSKGVLDGTSHYQYQTTPQVSTTSAEAADKGILNASTTRLTMAPYRPTDRSPKPNKFKEVPRDLSPGEGGSHADLDSGVEEDEKEDYRTTIEPADDETHVSILMKSMSKTDERIIWKRGILLGKGACSKVWKGLTSTGELVAVKMIDLLEGDQLELESQCRDIIKEVEILKTLEHPNVVRFLGASYENNIHVCIFMEFAPGGSIQNLIKTFGALEETVIAKYTKQIVEGIRYIHNKGVVHRDVKGQNIVVTNDGIIKLVDFGCAKRHTLTIAQSASNSVKPSIYKSVVGTPHWMAPEVVTESGHGRKSDIWSIGCTIIEMATGQPPWAELEPIAAIFAIGSGREQPELPETLSECAQDFTRSCMTRNPLERPSAQELQDYPFIRNVKEGTLLRNATFVKSRESNA